MNEKQQREKANRHFRRCVLLIYFPNFDKARKFLEQNVRGYSLSTKGSSGTILSLAIGSYSLCQKLSDEQISFTPLSPFIVDGIQAMSAFARIMDENLSAGETL